MNLLKHLNSQQLSAVTAPKGIVRVVAGAGSGKTSCITTKIAYEVHNGIPPEKIIALTFTKKAGIELKTRLRKIIGEKSDKVFAGTFHSFAHQLLSKVLTYSLITDNDVQDILKTITEDYSNFSYQMGDLAGILCYHRNLQKPYHDPILKEVEIKYKEFKVKNKLKDYDDLLEDVLTLLKKDFFPLDYLLVIVDEAQDNSGIQSMITKELIKKHRNLFIVGDAAQSIYSFRGASLESFIDWSKEGVTDYPLSVNYRSSQEVLKVANRILAGMPDSPKVELVAVKDYPDAPKAKLVKVGNYLDEVNYIAQKILEFRNQGKSFDSMAVLYRSHFISQTLQLKLAELKIPFTVWSGQNLLTASHIQDVICFMRAYTNKKDIIAWARIFRLIPKVGKVTAQKLAETAISSGINSVNHGGISPIVDIFKTSDPKEFLKNVENFYVPVVQRDHPDTSRDVAVKKFLDFARSHPDLKKFISDIIFSDSLEKESNGVVLTTIHQSKGLEWDTTFVMGIYDGVFPSFKNEEFFEELRLFYVAVTRAKTNLFCMFPEMTQKMQPTKSMFYDLVVHGKPIARKQF
jgi:DNA helicase-2/ATP-dependent DNA helicase PcrA